MKFVAFVLTSVFFSMEIVHASMQFKTFYTTKTGLEWGQTIGQFPNHCGSESDMYTNVCPSKPPSFPIPAPQASPFYSTGDSHALRACNAIGGRLPTFWEFRDLIEEFEHVKQRHDPYNGGSEYMDKFSLLTEKGKSDFKSVFTDTIVTPDRQQYYWIGSSRDYAFGRVVAVLISFEGENYKMFMEKPRHYRFSVRCVR